MTPNPPATQKPGATAARKALPLAILLWFVWGTNWVLFPLAVAEVSVWTFRSINLLGAGVLLLAVARARGESLVIPRENRATVATAALIYLIVWNIASTYAATSIPSGQAAILGFTMPLWTALIAWATMGQRPGPRVMAALALGALGVGLLIANGLHAYAQAPLGFAMGLLAGIGWAAGTLVLKQKPVRVSPLVLTGWQLLIAGVPITVVAFALGRGEWFMPTTTSIVVLAYTTLVPMAVGNAAWFSIVGLLPANIAGLSSVMVPVVAMLSGALVRHEPLGLVQWIAMVCCAGGVGLALQAPKSRG